MQEANRNGSLNHSTVLRYARRFCHDEVAIALEMMTGSKFDFIQQALASEVRESALIICKAAGLRWSVARAVLELNPSPPLAASRARRSYSKLTVAAVQRTLRF